MPQNPFGFIPYDDEPEDFGFIPYDTQPSTPVQTTPQSTFRYETQSEPAYLSSQPEKSWLQQWDESWFNQPLTTAPSTAARWLTGLAPNYDQMHQTVNDYIPGLGTAMAMGTGFARGATEAAGDLLSSFTSPSNLAQLAAFGGGGTLREVAPTAAKTLWNTGRALSAPYIGSGLARIGHGVQGDQVDWTDVGQGVFETAMGGTGMLEPFPRGLTRIANAASPETGTGQLDLPFGPRTPQQPTGPGGPLYEYPEIGPNGIPNHPDQTRLPFEEPVQEDLRFGAYQGPGGRFTTTGPPLKPTTISSLEVPRPAPLQPELRFGDELVSPTPLSTAAPSSTVVGAPASTPIQTPVTPSAPVRRDPLAIKGTPIANLNEFVIPANELDPKSTARTIEQGYSFETDKEGNGIFKRIQSQKGSIDIGDILKGLRELFGREPRIDEVNAEIERRGLRSEPVSEETGRVAPFIRPGTEGMDHYELPDGTVVPTDATATKGEQVIDFQLKGGEMVKARLVRRADLDKYGEPVRPNAPPPQSVSDYYKEQGIDIEEGPFFSGDETARFDEAQRRMTPEQQQENAELFRKMDSIERALRGEVEGTLPEGTGSKLVDLYLSGEAPAPVKKKPGFPSTIQHAFDPLENRPDLSQPSLPMPMEIRQKTRLEDIANVGAKGAHEFGPTQGEFDFTTPTPSGRKGIRGQEGALNVGDIAQAVKGGTKKAYDWTFKGDVDPVTGKKGPSFAGQVWSLPSQATTVGDFTSAIGRQGLGAIHTPEFWKALYATLHPTQGAWTKEGFRRINDLIKSKPIFQAHFNRATGIEPSLMEQIAGKDFLIENSADVNASERSAAGNWIETGGSIPYFSRGYRETIGRFYTQPSNRLYATFLNHLRANRVESLLEGGKKLAETALETGEARPGFLKQKFTPEQAVDLNPYHNLPLAKEMIDYVNAATGRGGLGKLESSAEALGKVLFSPRLLASRVKMMNPLTYMMASPQVRKQYLGSALAVVGAWIGMAELADKSGLPGIEVSWNPRSADFGKIRIGNTRIDLGGGFQQLVVGLSRIVSGKEAPSTGGKEFELGQGYRADTRLTIIQRVLANKLNPSSKGVYDFFNASERVPLHVMDRTAQMFVPLINQDIVELMREDNGLYTLPLLVLMNFGAGTQIYEGGESTWKFVPPENDILFKGGSFNEDESPIRPRRPRPTR